MSKSLNQATYLFAAAIMLLGSAMAQQPVAGTPQSTPPSGQAPAAAQTQSTPQAQPAPTYPPQLPTQKDRFSYALGMSLGKSLTRDGVEVDPAVLEQGLKDTL